MGYFVCYLWRSCCWWSDLIRLLLSWRWGAQSGQVERARHGLKVLQCLHFSASSELPGLASGSPTVTLTGKCVGLQTTGLELSLRRTVKHIRNILSEVYSHHLQHATSTERSEPACQWGLEFCSVIRGRDWERLRSGTTSSHPGQLDTTRHHQQTGLCQSWGLLSPDYMIYIFIINLYIYNSY